MSKNHKIVTISPSGNLYGSENVLFDYLCTTELNHIVFVPKDSQFEQKLKSQKWNHRIKRFNPKRLELFYTNLILLLLTSRIKSVYVNEGGHYKWIKLIAQILPRIKFTVHLRMVYDAKTQRIGFKTLENIRLIAISEYVAQELKKNRIKVDIIYDGFKCQNNITKEKTEDKSIYQVAIIGRIAESKGIFQLPQILKELDKQNEIEHFSFNLYGEIMLSESKEAFDLETKKYKNYIHLKGFKTTDEIFKTTHLVLHLSKEEGLGRIFLESICFKKPFIGFYSSGLREIANLTGLDELMVDLSDNEQDNAKSIAEKLTNIKRNYSEYSEKINPSKDLEPFSIAKYSYQIDSILL
ncbi:MAG: glycosyltransferase [Brumimicrobium sp.]|nr:glycosyltransferase [Brumimicrobium sp.]